MMKISKKAANSAAFCKTKSRFLQQLFIEFLKGKFISRPYYPMVISPIKILLDDAEPSAFINAIHTSAGKPL